MIKRNYGFPLNSIGAKKNSTKKIIKKKINVKKFVKKSPVLNISVKGNVMSGVILVLRNFAHTQRDGKLKNFRLK